MSAADKESQNQHIPQTCPLDKEVTGGIGTEDTYLEERRPGVKAMWEENYSVSFALLTVLLFSLQSLDRTSSTELQGEGTQT